MTRTEIRQLRSQMRSEEYRKEKLTNRIILFSAIALYIVPRLLWYIAVEMGYVQPIQSAGLREVLSNLSFLLTLVVVFALPKFFRIRERETKLDEAEERALKQELGSI